MENFTPVSATIGGMLIGISAIWLMASAGRIAGISGILGGIIKGTQSDRLWRFNFLLGLMAGPFLVWLFRPQSLSTEFPTSGPILIIAAILVGLGTQIGSGCTSGHGVCGNARFSLRSLIATMSFMVTGIVTVFIFRHVIGG
jgi:uncharacterized membrane protein YedE/YeeE